MTTILANNGLSVDKLTTSDAEIAPHGGTVLYKMNGIATASAPLAAGFDPSKVEDELEALGEAMNCDMSLEERQWRR